jgi:hypothetical protein
LLEILLEADDIEELFGFEHVTDDGAGIQVSLFIVVGAKKSNELGDSYSLLSLDLTLEFDIVVRIDLGKQFVQNL